MPVLATPDIRYLETKIATATKEELTLMLYEGALRFCNQAIIALEGKDYVKMNNLIKRACDIILELQYTLDRKYPISKEFDNLYTFIIDKMAAGATDHDVTAMSDARDLIRDFRDTWKEAMKIAKNEAHG